jgi:hypothetical protein
VGGWAKVTAGLLGWLYLADFIGRAGRFERAPPCAQGRFEYGPKAPVFNCLRFGHVTRDFETSGSIMKPEETPSYKTICNRGTAFVGHAVESKVIWCMKSTRYMRMACFDPSRQ